MEAGNGAGEELGNAGLMLVAAVQDSETQSATEFRPAFVKARNTKPALSHSTERAGWVTLATNLEAE